MGDEIRTDKGLGMMDFEENLRNLWLKKEVDFREVLYFSRDQVKFTERKAGISP
ncbi:MAG: hypothetical protein PF442_00405 [Desulfobulbaceae bacterium]|jgi:hypothetical protein|nr:hypothetical protein [Desulfobulbaceae bacterium]